MIDAYVHHNWASEGELVPYLPAGWAALLDPRGSGHRFDAVPAPSFAHPVSDYLTDEDGERRGAAADPASLSKQWLDPESVERAVLGFDDALLAPVALNPFLGLELVRAANAWLLDRWLAGQDARFYGLALVPNHMPEEAAAEIRAVGEHERIVGVVMAGNGLGKPFGSPVFEPIYRAAAELRLPVVLHVGGDQPPNTLTHPTAGGLPSTYGELYVLRAQALMNHLTSLIVLGVLERFRDLKVLLVGAGVGWIPGYLWRLDSDFKSYGARETPWVERLPSEQFAEQVRVSTYALRGVTAPGLRRLREALDGLEDLLCYVSGFPRWDTDGAGRIGTLLPAGDRRKVLHDNAAALFRWPAQRSRPARPDMDAA